MPSNSGKYVSPNIIESQQTDNAAYNRIIYEDSPLHRIIKQIGSGDAGILYKKESVLHFH